MQLLNAGCRIASIQRFLGHKKLNTTIIYARAHDQTVADDYFAAMQRIEQRLGIPSDATQRGGNEVIKVPERTRALELTKQLATPELCQEERLSIAIQLRELLGPVLMQASPKNEWNYTDLKSSSKSCEALPEVFTS